MIEKVKKVNDAFHGYHSSRRNIVDARFREKGIYFGQPPILKYLSDINAEYSYYIRDDIHRIEVYNRIIEKLFGESKK